MKRLSKYVGVSLLSGGLLFGGLGLLPGGQAQTNPTKPTPAKLERHPHIRKSIHELREARKELKTAAHDFGGHREKAVEAIDVAIKQLENALKYDKH